MIKSMLHRNNTASKYKLLIQLLSYLISGSTVALVQFGTFFVLQILTENIYILSSTIAFFVAVATSYILQRNVTFATNEVRKMDQYKASLLFLLNAGFSLLLNSVIMYTGVKLLGLNPYTAQVVSMAILATYNFVAYRFIFK